MSLQFTPESSSSSVLRVSSEGRLTLTEVLSDQKPLTSRKARWGSFIWYSKPGISLSFGRKM